MIFIAIIIYCYVDKERASSKRGKRSKRKGEMEGKKMKRRKEREAEIDATVISICMARYAETEKCIMYGEQHICIDYV